MNKKEVEQILIIVKLEGKEALHLKVYKNGTICRRGCGSLPEIGIAAISHTGSADIFDKLMNVVPQQILDNPINYKDEKITSPLEYIIAFYGVSSNGETGENAEWTKSTGIKLLLNANTSSSSALPGFAETFCLKATELTNSWYFDVIIHAVYKLRSAALPQETMLTLPPPEKDIQTDFKNYVQQIRNSSRKWDITSFANDKTYINSHNKQFAPFVVQNEESFSIRFIPIAETPSGNPTAGEATEKWWKVW